MSEHATPNGVERTARRLHEWRQQQLRNPVPWDKLLDYERDEYRREAAFITEAEE